MFLTLLFLVAAIGVCLLNFGESHNATIQYYAPQGQYQSDVDKRNWSVNLQEGTAMDLLLAQQRGMNSAEYNAELARQAEQAKMEQARALYGTKTAAEITGATINRDATAIIDTSTPIGTVSPSGTGQIWSGTGWTKPENVPQSSYTTDAAIQARSDARSVLYAAPPDVATVGMRDAAGNLTGQYAPNILFENAAGKAQGAVPLSGYALAAYDRMEENSRRLNTGQYATVSPNTLIASPLFVSGAYEMATEAARRGDVLDPTVYAAAAKQGYGGGAYLPMVNGQIDMMAGRSTVPIRSDGEMVTDKSGRTTFVPYMGNTNVPMTGGTNIFVPLSMSEQQVRENSKIAFNDYGAYSVAQVVPSTMPGFTRIYPMITAGGGTGALQSGTVSGKAQTPLVYDAYGLTPLFDTTNPTYQDMLKNPQNYSRLGSELYGGKVQPLTGKTLQGEFVKGNTVMPGRFARDSMNYSNLVDFGAVNRPKSAMGKSDLPLYAQSSFDTTPLFQKVDTTTGKLEAVYPNFEPVKTNVIPYQQPEFILSRGEPVATIYRQAPEPSRLDSDKYQRPGGMALINNPNWDVTKDLAENAMATANADEMFADYGRNPKFITQTWMEPQSYKLVKNPLYGLPQSAVVEPVVNTYNNKYWVLEPSTNSVLRQQENVATTPLEVETYFVNKNSKGGGIPAPFTSVGKSFPIETNDFWNAGKNAGGSAFVQMGGVVPTKEPVSTFNVGLLPSIGLTEQLAPSKNNEGYNGIFTTTLGVVTNVQKGIGNYLEAWDKRIESEGGSPKSMNWADVPIPKPSPTFDEVRYATQGSGPLQIPTNINPVYEIANVGNRLFNNPVAKAISDNASIGIKHAQDSVNFYVGLSKEGGLMQNALAPSSTPTPMIDLFKYKSERVGSATTGFMAYNLFGFGANPEVIKLAVPETWTNTTTLSGGNATITKLGNWFGSNKPTTQSEVDIYNKNVDTYMKMQEQNPVIATTISTPSGGAPSVVNRYGEWDAVNAGIGNYLRNTFYGGVTPEERARQEKRVNAQEGVGGIFSRLKFGTENFIMERPADIATTIAQTAGVYAGFKVGGAVVAKYSASSLPLADYLKIVSTSPESASTGAKVAGGIYKHAGQLALLGYGGYVVTEGGKATPEKTQINIGYNIPNMMVGFGTYAAIDSALTTPPAESKLTPPSKGGSMGGGSGGSIKSSGNVINIQRKLLGLVDYSKFDLAPLVEAIPFSAGTIRGYGSELPVQLPKIGNEVIFRDMYAPEIIPKKKNIVEIVPTLPKTGNEFAPYDINAPELNYNFFDNKNAFENKNKNANLYENKNQNAYENPNAYWWENRNQFGVGLPAINKNGFGNEGNIVNKNENVIINKNQNIFSNINALPNTYVTPYIYENINPFKYEQVTKKKATIEKIPALPLWPGIPSFGGGSGGGGGGLRGRVHTENLVYDFGLKSQKKGLLKIGGSGLGSVGKNTMFGGNYKSVFNIDNLIDPTKKSTPPVKTNLPTLSLGGVRKTPVKKATAPTKSIKSNTGPTLSTLLFGGMGQTPTKKTTISTKKKLVDNGFALNNLKSISLPSSLPKKKKKQS